MKSDATLVVGIHHFRVLHAEVMNTKFSPLPINFKLSSALTVAIVSWSSAWISIRVAVAHYSPGQLALGRYLVALLVLAPLLIGRRPRFAKRDWPLVWAAGICGFTLYNLGINAGEMTITAGAAALIASTIPLLTTLGAQIFLGESVRKRVWVGGAIALWGVALIAFGAREGVGFSPGALLVLVACFGSAAYALLQKTLLGRGYAGLDITTMAILCGVLMLIPFGGGLVAAVKRAPLVATANLVLLGVFPGALGYLLWTYALSKLPVARVMVFLYLIAPLSILMDWGFLGEIPTYWTLLGGAIALGGVIFANRQPK